MKKDTDIPVTVAEIEAAFQYIQDKHSFDIEAEQELNVEAIKRGAVCRPKSRQFSWWQFHYAVAVARINALLRKEKKVKRGE